MTKELFQANRDLFAAAFGARISDIDWELSERLRNQCLSSELPGWRPDREHLLLPPRLMPPSDEVEKSYQKIASKYEFGKGIGQYLEVYVEDPHLFAGLVRLRRAVKESGFDPDLAHTTTASIRPSLLVALGTGDGQELAGLIQRFQPSHLMVAVQDWIDFTTSFWTIDWHDLSRQYNHNPSRRLTIGCYTSATDILATLFGISIGQVDHALVYVPPTASERTREIQKELTEKLVDNATSYLGFTLDEYNMVWHAWKALQKQPKVFKQPSLPIGGRYVICGSGPSLDAALPKLASLSKTHQIVACASNYRSLRAAGVDVDILVLLERGESMVEDYREIVNEYGFGKTKLILSVTCPAQLQELFGEAAVYFRPALTPLALFADSPREVLCYEGPQSINTGVALVSALKAEQVVLVGVDLGVRSVSQPRSVNAAGVSPREFTIECPGNFGGTVLTDRFLLDGQLSLEHCIKAHSDVKFFNASDGLYIEGAEPKPLAEYIQLFGHSDADPSRAAFLRWWEGLSHYRPARFQASWRSRRPRQAIKELFDALRDLYGGTTPWFPDLLQKSTELLNLDVSLAEQFPRRIIRGTLHKLTLAITRQFQIMGSEPDAMAQFGSRARPIIVELLNQLEIECYQLCDQLESLPND